MIQVLLVDDSRVTREVTKLYLVQRKDVTVQEARSGEEALKSIRAHRPDVVLADMQMPHLDGTGLCAAMKADPALSDIPVVILTSVQDPRARAQCLAAGAREILAKPVEPEHLNEALHRALGERFPLGVPKR
ncbi:MAG: response regulator [Archangium sp.]|nr:response regulator [Archangium sp.]